MGRVIVTVIVIEIEIAENIFERIKCVSNVTFRLLHLSSPFDWVEWRSSKLSRIRAEQ